MMNSDSKFICIFLITFMVGFWASGLLLWMLPLPDKMTWWTIPWAFTVAATGILVAIIAEEVLTKQWRKEK